MTKIQLVGAILTVMLFLGIFSATMANLDDSPGVPQELTSQYVSEHTRSGFRGWWDGLFATDNTTPPPPPGLNWWQRLNWGWTHP